MFNRQSRERFWRAHTTELTASLGREPSYAERLLIDRLAASLWQQQRLEAKMDAGEELSSHAMRAYNATGNRIRLDLAALGLKPPAARPPTPQEALARVQALLHPQAAP